MASLHQIKQYSDMNAVISAIVVNYNAGNLLKDCVKSLLACPLDVEVIIVDNASTDNSLATLEKLPHTRIIKNNVNMGFAAACNKGITAASADYLLFLNPDSSIAPNTLVNLLSAATSDDRVGMTGGLLINPDGSEQAGGRRAIPTPWRSFVRAFGLARFEHRWPRLFFDFHLHKQPLPDHPIEVEAISGACMLVKRKAVQDVGIWDEGYFLHCEDLDWCMRFRQKGWRIVFVPNARVIHTQGVCGKARPIFVEWHKHKGMIRFYRKFFKHQYPGILMGLVVIGVWFRFSLLVSYYAFSQLLRCVWLMNKL